MHFTFLLSHTTPNHLLLLSPIQFSNPPSMATLLSLLILTLSLTSTAQSSPTSRDQIACTMCDACENPCQPLQSPPPPPPPAAVSNCPPPPSSGTLYNSPPPPSKPTYAYPPPAGVFYYPPPDSGNFPGGGYGAPPPPNPIVPYFPFYYYNPPPSSDSKLRCSIVSMISVFIIALCFF